MVESWLYDKHLPEWIRELMLALGGFLAGRLGSAVDHEMRSHHAVVAAIPALTTAVDALRDQIHDLQRSDEQLRHSDDQLRGEVQEARVASEHRHEQLLQSLSKLDERLDALASAESVFISGSRRRMEGVKPATARDRHGCEAQRWVPPLDRPDFAGGSTVGMPSPDPETDADL